MRISRVNRSQVPGQGPSLPRERKLGGWPGNPWLTCGELHGGCVLGVEAPPCGVPLPPPPPYRSAGSKPRAVSVPRPASLAVLSCCLGLAVGDHHCLSKLPVGGTWFWGGQA